MTGFEPRLIEVAGQINNQMPTFLVSRIADALNDRQKSLKGSKILGLGVAYKRDVNDIRESPALEVLHRLHEKGALIFYSDPHVPRLELADQQLHSLELTPATLRSMDCIAVLTDHSTFDYAMIAAHSPLVIDSRNALREFSGSHILSF